ncbi:MAG: hypothetical protein H6882_03435 [Rhodobiaceae bacterium]|nr:hypothetical protein [Rhodobiaceae bacterium]
MTTSDHADAGKYVLDAGRPAGAGDQLGTVLYNRGMVATMWAVGKRPARQ